jgi:hypothetical protein
MTLEPSYYCFTYNTIQLPTALRVRPNTQHCSECSILCHVCPPPPLHFQTSHTLLPLLVSACEWRLFECWLIDQSTRWWLSSWDFQGAAVVRVLSPMYGSRGAVKYHGTVEAMVDQYYYYWSTIHSTMTLVQQPLYSTTVSISSFTSTCVTFELKTKIPFRTCAGSFFMLLVVLISFHSPSFYAIPFENY